MNKTDLINYIRASIFVIKFRRYEKGYLYHEIEYGYLMALDDIDDALFNTNKILNGKCHTRKIVYGKTELDITDGYVNFCYYRKDMVQYIKRKPETFVPCFDEKSAKSALVIRNLDDEICFLLSSHNWINKKVIHKIQDMIIKMFMSDYDASLKLDEVLPDLNKYMRYKEKHRRHFKR